MPVEELEKERSDNEDMDGEADDHDIQNMIPLEIVGGLNALGPHMKTATLCGRVPRHSGRH